MPPKNPIEPPNPVDAGPKTPGRGQPGRKNPSKGARGKPKHFFAAGDKAKALFEKNSLEYVKLHLETAKKAAESGDFDAALKGAEWGLLHQKSVVSPSVDEQRQADGGSRGPSVLIQFPFPPGHPALLTAGAQQPAIEGETLSVNQDRGESSPKAQDVKPLQHKVL